MGVRARRRTAHAPRHARGRLADEAVGLLERAHEENAAALWYSRVVVREALHHELQRREPDVAAALHRSLCRYHLQSHPPDPRAAVEHAALAGDWTLLETCWIDFGTYLVATGGPAVEAVYRAVPDQVTLTSTVLMIARAAARRTGDEAQDVRELVLRLLTEMGVLALDGRWRSLTPPGRWTGAAVALVAARGRGDLRRAMSVVRDTEVAAGRAAVTGGAGGRSYWWFLVQAGRTALLEGDMGAALELPVRAYELADPYRAPDVRAAAAAHVALVHAVDGVVLDADRWLVRHVEALAPDWEERVRDRAADVAEAMVATDRLDRDAADVALARVDLAVRSPDVTWPYLMYARIKRAVLFRDAPTGLAELDQMERMQHAWVHEARMVRRLLLRMRAELFLTLGELHRLRDLLADADPADTWCDIPRARWQLLTGDPHTALRTAVLGGRRRRVSIADRTDLFVLEAWAAHETHQPDAAVRAFRSARRLADEQHQLRSFAHLPASVRDALADVAELPFEPSERARLDATGGVVPESGELGR